MADLLVGHPVDVWPNDALFEHLAQQPEVIDADQPFSGKIVHLNEDGTANVVFDDHHGARHWVKDLRLQKPNEFHTDKMAWGSTRIGWRPYREEGEDEPAAQLPATTATGQGDHSLQSTTSG